MKKSIIIILLVACSICAKAQTTNTTITEHDAAVKARDAEIKTNIIDPAQQDANGQVPDWKTITQTIEQKYDAVTADRTVTKAKIYYYYGKDWPAFCSSIVHYTDKYELADDYPLLNKNATMILKYSDDKKELEAALSWSKRTLDKEPQNETYKKTYAALQEKLANK